MKLLEPRDVPKLLRPGMSVFVQGGAGEPTAILQALLETPDCCAEVEFISVQTPGVNRTDFSKLHPSAGFTSFFLIPEALDSLRAGRVRFLPLHYSDIDRYIASRQINLAIVQFAPPDGSGHCNAGTSAEFLPTLLQKDTVVVAELNKGMPWISGGVTVPVDRIQYGSHVSHPLAELQTGGESPVAATVAKNAARLVKDGDTLQIGVGRLPAQILRALRAHNDLGFHSGLISDAAIALMDGGIVTNARKPIDKGFSVGTVALGSAEFYKKLGSRDDVLIRPVSYTHDVDTIAQFTDFVSLNSALEVDLDGQVNAEHLNGIQVGGAGGFVDFVRGARRAANGRSVVAIEATARGGTVSRIKPRLTSVVTCLRGDIDYVVTEFGIANLRHASIRERQQALIAIAAPQFRDELIEAARDLN